MNEDPKVRITEEMIVAYLQRVLGTGKTDENWTSPVGETTLENYRYNP